MSQSHVIVDTGVAAVENDALQSPAPYYAVAHPYATRPGCWNYNKVAIFDRATETQVGEYTRNYSSMYRTFHPFQLRGKWYALYARNYTATRIMSLPDCTDIGGEEPRGHGFCPTDFWVPPLHWLEFLHDATCPRNPRRPCGPDYREPCTCKFRHKPGCELGLPHPPINDRGGYNWQNCLCKTEQEAWDAARHRWHFPDRVYGFIAGCIWGDDSSWKIEFLDLSRADEGILTREARFGYIELPRGLTLSQAVHVESDDDGSPPFLRIDTCRGFDILTGKVDEA